MKISDDKYYNSKSGKGLPMFIILAYIFAGNAENIDFSTFHTWSLLLIQFRATTY